MHRAAGESISKASRTLLNAPQFKNPQYAERGGFREATPEDANASPVRTISCHFDEGANHATGRMVTYQMKMARARTRPQLPS